MLSRGPLSRVLSCPKGDEMENAPKPAYVKFEFRPIENREKSIEAGHVYMEDVLFAVITPSGTKDRIEKRADEWIASVEEGVKQERIPEAWLYAYRDAMKRFEETREDPEFGIPLANWGGLTPAQLANCLNANIRTVEDLAAATEEGLGRIGMGGYALKMKAQAYMDTAKNSGAAAEELAALRQKNSELELRDKEREEQFKAMAARLEALENAGAKTKEKA
jgi:hypothetical protein